MLCWQVMNAQNTREELPMSAYTGDAKTLTCEELKTKLRELAKAWKDEPHLSNDYSEGVRFGELKEALEDRCKETCKIRAIDKSTDYEAVFSTVSST